MVRSTSSGCSATIVPAESARSRVSANLAEIVLLYLDAHGRVPQTDLVHYLGRDRSTVTATLQAMERASLVTRIPSATDKRAMTVRLTQKGRRTVPHAQAAWAELERRTTANLTPTQHTQLLTAPALVRDALNHELAR